MRLECLVLEFGFVFSVLVVGCENDNGGIWCLCLFVQAKRAGEGDDARW